MIEVLEKRKQLDYWIKVVVKVKEMDDGFIPLKKILQEYYNQYFLRDRGHTIVSA